MDTDASLNDSRMIHGDLTRTIIGSAMEVINELGHGFNEKNYENAMVHEFSLRGVSVSQQQQFDVMFKGVRVGYYIPDLIAGNSVIVDAKCIDRITEHEVGQMLNYLRITNLPVGLIINFKHAKLEWRRVLLT